MPDLKSQLEHSLSEAAKALGAQAAEVAVQTVPEGKPGDYGTPLAFTLARQLRRNPAQIAAELLENLTLPPGVARAEAVGPYLNFFLDPAAFVSTVVQSRHQAAARGKKAIIEHTSVNPNKEAHVGHLRNIVLGDSVARILREDGFEVEVHNYIDDTGRQAAESLFAIDWFNAEYDGSVKFDHWLGQLYVQLGKAKETSGPEIEAGVSEVMHRLERGELREEVERIVHSQLETFEALGASYDLLVWESDVVQSGFLQAGLDILINGGHAVRPETGKYKGALVIDVSEFLPGLEESSVVLVRADGNAMYVAKDIGYQFWKAGLFEGLRFSEFAVQHDGRKLWSSNPQGSEHPDGLSFAHGDRIINVIDVRQSHPQAIVRTALALSETPEGQTAFENSHHLAYEVVTLEGQAMSGRKGITLSIDEALAEAVRRAAAVISEKNPVLADSQEIARQVGLGALRFAMVKSEAKRIIDFRWEQALSLQGDSAPYVQYAHARASSILRAAAGEGLTLEAAAQAADWNQVGELEVKLALVIARYGEVVTQAARELAPHGVAQYALELANAWNSYYNHRDASGRPDTQVLRAAPGLREARLLLVARVRQALHDVLGLLGIDAPEEM
jgi:arginyl-tRNA synthetase